MHAFRFRLPDGDRNVRTVYLPDGHATSLPILIVCFGGTSDRQPYPITVELCHALTDAGAAIVTFDFYGWGDPDSWSYGR